MQNIINILDKNGLIFAFLVVGVIMYLSFLIGKKVTNNKIPAAAIAISFGLFIAYFGKGEKLSFLENYCHLHPSVSDN